MGSDKVCILLLSFELIFNKKVGYVKKIKSMFLKVWLRILDIGVSLGVIYQWRQLSKNKIESFQLHGSPVLCYQW